MATKKSKTPTKADLKAGCVVTVPGVEGLEFRLEYCLVLIPHLSLAGDKKAVKAGWPAGSDFYPSECELTDICVWARFEGDTSEPWSLLGATQELKRHWFDKDQFKAFKHWVQQLAALHGLCAFGQCYTGEIDL